MMSLDVSLARRAGLTFRRDVLSRRSHGLAKDRKIAHVIGEQQDELGVDQRALLLREIAVHVDQLLIEIVRLLNIRLRVEQRTREQTCSHAASIASTQASPVARAIAART